MAILGLPTEAITEDFGGIAMQGAQMLNQQLQQNKINEDKEYQKKLDFEDRYGLNESLFQLEDTEFRTVNDATTEALSLYRDRYYDVYKQLEEDPTNLGLKKRLGKIKNSVTMMGQANTKMQAIGADYLAKIEAGEISGVDADDWQAKIEATEKGNLKINVDENDSLQLLFYDNDGKLNSVLPYKELIGSSLIKKFDTDTELNEMVKTLGGYTSSSKEGMYIRTQNLYGQKQIDTVDDWLSGQLQDPEVTADLLYQATGQKKATGHTDADKEAIRGFIQGQVQGRYSETDTIKADGVAVASMRVAASNRAADAKTVSSSDVNIATNGEAPLMRPDGSVEFTIGKGGIAIDPNKKLSRMVSGIIQQPDGTLALKAMDTEKIKGVQNEDGSINKEETAKQAGVTLASIFADKDENNAVTYYKRVPKIITMDDEPDAISRMGNKLKVQDEAGLSNMLKGRFNARFPDKAQSFYNGQMTAPNQEQPTNASRFNNQ